MPKSTITFALSCALALTFACVAEQPDTPDSQSSRSAKLGNECKHDGHCGAGLVCEPEGPGCGPGSACVPGCHEDEDCGEAEHCEQLNCFTCPCPGQCEPDVDADCSDDDDCGAGSVCEPSGPLCGPDNTCVPGCHGDDQCADNEFCQQLNCLTCPCPGQCEPVPDPGCADDYDCAPGTVCEPEGPGCGPSNACVPGCHSNADCSYGQSCQQVFCFTCPCPGQCS